MSERSEEDLMARVEVHRVPTAQRDAGRDAVAGCTTGAPALRDTGH